MKFAFFVHSLVSDWNHGNAHFLRGVVSELLSRGHVVNVYEPLDAWSVANLVDEHGHEPIAAFHAAYPALSSIRYTSDLLDLDSLLSDVDVVIVHEWNESELVQRLGAHRREHDDLVLFFHDTHHRSATRPEEMVQYDLSSYDGVLAFGNVVRDIYLERQWAERVWTWHEAADVRRFRPLANEKEGDLVWVGNWGDDERTQELQEFLLDPVADLGLTARVHGVRYPDDALEALESAGIDYGGWLPNFRVPDVLSRYRVTVHVPRAPYTEKLPGIPTIRPFEALACGIPLVCSPWSDVEGLFTPGTDYLLARDGREMRAHLRMLLNDRETADALAEHGRQTILTRHTCAHRVDELLDICRALGAGEPAEHGRSDGEAVPFTEQHP